MQMRLLTREEIKQELPTVRAREYWDDHWVIDLKTARKLFGRNVIELTPKVAQQLIGKEFQCIRGQLHGEYDTVAEKMDAVTKLRALAFNENDTSKSFPNLVLQEGNHKYEAYVFEGLYTTGSGADPIYVFAHE